MQKIIDDTLELARKLQNSISNNLSEQEKAFHSKMQKLLSNPENKVMLIELMDRSFRCLDNKARFEMIEHVLDKYKSREIFSSFEKLLLMGFLSFGKMLPNMSVPFFVSKIRSDTKAMVLEQEESKLKERILARKNEKITLNVNFIGEEVLGEEEANARFEKYSQALKSNYIQYISIKITTIFSQINILDFEYSKKEIVKRLDALYALALEEEQKQGIPKFINLDMEEFRDLELTVESFMESISKFDLNAGIVLQAYIPDSYEYLKKLHAFSKERVLKGLKPIKIRFVKGANMESEETIASVKDWELPTFSSKQDTDSNYNKMLDFILEGDNYKYIHIGTASHNIFEIAYVYTRIHAINDPIALEHFTFEMLEGMSLQASLELKDMHKLILYAPVCDEAHFNNAIAYLVRRLDENTSSDNFMKAFFNLKVDTKEWKDQEQRFLNSLKGIATLNNSTKRTQDRNAKQSGHTTYKNNSFKNESDTDFILKANREWAKKVREKMYNAPILELYPEINGRFENPNLTPLEVFDKIHHKKIASVHLADEEAILKALEVAKSDKSHFSQKSFEEIHALMSRTAQLFRERRGDLIGISALEVGKTFVETDAEVSEAIDFLEFYPYSLRVLQEQNKETQFAPKGVGVVIAPWNFPVGISVGTIAAPLAAGNRVIYKPSSLSSVTGYKLCECFWDAGVPRDALIYLPAKGSDISKYLLKDESIKFAILTGGEDTAYKMLEANPTLALSAETGGKNATIVSKMADRDQAIKNIVHSAFSNSGQKCSATSLLVLEKEVYEDENFKKTLIDATLSLNVGDPFDFKNKIGTLADKPNEKVKKAMNELEKHEHYEIPVSFVNDNPYLMKPSIKYGTKKGDFTHLTELFTPILSVMKAQDLDDAIEIVNSTGYGLTSALESLDEREWEHYLERIEAGNIYINKPTTGAIVLRQPFGGIKKSAVGFGRKVGIFNYITQFVDIHQEKEDDNILESNLSECLESLTKKGYDEHTHELNRAIFMAKSYAYHYKHEFSQAKDYVKIRGEDNLFSYAKVKNVGYRITENDDLSDMLGIALACLVAQIPLTLSVENKQTNKNLAFFLECLNALRMNAPIFYESLQEFSEKLSDFNRVRYLNHKLDLLHQKASSLGIVLATTKPCLNGRFELLYYHLERSVSISYHRYGNLGSRALEQKACHKSCFH
ncbi:bifunctional proline dehydrogenase/L-glutamate gamma-semialdehyde dehydrogenase [Helicobacter cetorum]|uniref:bifunctional proline dehydrogenase/L-glutamate gamma-semialdehyde dehydrogenase n=1 Tax=Helicobacter cetorum TaxID=138563 RepID=UPI000CF11B66|nr:bifunctional proline dehydrogenase/L-glutamate gamma-semialdehyde dehydrogenase [Helicobacter cetorum]